MIIAAGTVSLNILYDGLRVYADGVIDKHEKEAFSKKNKNIPDSRLARVQKSYPIYDQYGQNPYSIYMYDPNG